MITKLRYSSTLVLVTIAAAVCCLLLFATPAVQGGITRTYYIAIEEELWDYAPLQRDGAMEVSFKRAVAKNMMMASDIELYAIRSQ